MSVSTFLTYAMRSGSVAHSQSSTKSKGASTGSSLMFSDLLNAGYPVTPNIIVENAKHLDPKAQIVGDVANIIELKVAADVYQNYCRVA